MRYLIYYIIDKILFLFSLINNNIDLTKTFRFSKNQKKEGIHYNYSEIWQQFIESINYEIGDVDTIYYLQMSLYSEESYEKVKYLIRNKFWNYLEFYDEDYFPREFMKFKHKLGSSLCVFYLKSNSKNNLILIVKLENGTLTLKWHTQGIIPLYRIRQREIFYNKDRDIYVF